MTALAKFKLSEWPFAGPVALIERDEFGMREDFHLISYWRHLGTVHDEAELHDLLEIRCESRFDPDIYRIINKFLKAGKVRLLPLPRP
jgi:DNA polymerase-3 subunit epsilon